MNRTTIAIDISRGGEHVASIAPQAEVIKIGRLRSNQIVLTGDSVARVHAAIEITAGAVELLDLGDPQGVAVNGQRVDRRARLVDGDALTIGEYRLVVALKAAALAPAVAPASLPVAAVVAAAPAEQSEHERCDGSQVAEVIAVYGDTVVDVQHISATATRGRHAHWLALGGALTIGGLALFAHELGQDWEGARAAQMDAQLRGETAPVGPGTGLGGLGGALALLGLLPLALGMTRARDRVLESYSIGESPAASFPVSGASLPDPGGFPIVFRRGDALEFGFTAAMDGEVELDGQAVELQTLARSGRTQAHGQHHALPLPLGARARVRHGDLTFHVHAVRPAALKAGRAPRDAAFWGYNAGSLAVIGALIATSQMIPADAQDLVTEDPLAGNRFVGYLSQADLRPEVETETTETIPDEGARAESTGARHRGTEGKAGSPTSTATNKALAIKSISKVQGIGRNFDPEQSAAKAGILGIFAQNEGDLIASPLSRSLASGSDDDSFWGNVTGESIGDSYGVGGLGLVGSGRSGGGDASGTIGLSSVGLVGRCAGSNCTGTGEYGGGATTGFRERGPRAPVVRTSVGDVTGALDKDVVRRIVRAHINEVRHCYNQGLVHDPLLRGRVAIQFSIGAGGDVLSSVASETSIKDPSVNQCIAKAVRRWKFPKPQGGGTVLVSYPFVLDPGRA